MNLNKDIIPVTYMSGTGGSFLARFITFAKLNSKDILNLSKHGNAHTGYIELPRSVLGPVEDDIIKIEHILNIQPCDGVFPIYYVPVHIVDLQLCMNFFEKAIRITYEKDDIADVAICYVGKYHVDAIHNESSIFNLNLHSQMMLLKFANQFSTMKLNSNVLHISWKEILHYDPNILITKLNNFTQIPKENFNIENLYNWRKATISCIETLSIAK
jgi:hypothetical protein